MATFYDKIDLDKKDKRNNNKTKKQTLKIIIYYENIKSIWRPHFSTMYVFFCNILVPINNHIWQFLIY